jgi:hypothetical protein
MSDITQQILDLNQKLLNSIFEGDWKTYEDLCDPSVTCFEPEAGGHLIEGMPFHKFYFDLAGASKGGSGALVNVTMATPVVKQISPDVALCLYTRLVQCVTPTGPITKRVEETRVWRKQSAGWKLVHLHRSAPGM